MPVPKTALAQRSPPPPYTRWDQRGNPVLLSYLKLIDGKQLCLSLQRDDPDIAKRHMRLLVAMSLAKGRLSQDGGAAEVYAPKGGERSRLKKIDTEVQRLRALPDAKYGPGALATAKRWGRPVGIIHHLVGRKPETSAGTYRTRRSRARKRGRKTPIGNTWEHRAQGGKGFLWNGKVLTARLHIGGQTWQWPLNVIDEEAAEALMAPVRIARQALHRAAVEELDCELGTDAGMAAAAARGRARTLLAKAIIEAGGRKKLVEFVLKGPQEEVRTSVVQKLRIPRAERNPTAVSPANYQLEVARARRLGQDASKSVQDERRRLKPAPRFMQWAQGPGGKLVLQCAVYLSDESRLSYGLKTDDTEVVGPQRMRLLLWHAIAEEQLPGGLNHPAWGLYGGPIPQAIERLLRRLAALPPGEYEFQRTPAAQRLGYHARTIDWLTNQEKARQTDPVRRAQARKNARTRARRIGKRTPISKSWQFGAVGGMLAAHSDGHLIYAQLTIAGFTMRWRLTVQNRVEAESLVKPAVDARARVREAARNWRECPVGSPEAKTALAAVLDEQRRFRDGLLAAGAKRAKGWAEVLKALNEPPFDESSRPIRREVRAGSSSS